MRRSAEIGLLLALAGSLLAQQPITFQYFYDDLGQLAKVVDSTGVVVGYGYDAVGNILQVSRSTVTPGQLSIFNFTPQTGGAGATVTIQGQAFSPTASSNIVKFNGALATVISAASTALVVTVPVTATTGPISVAVGTQTAVSSSDFAFIPVPGILLEWTPILRQPVNP